MVADCFNDLRNDLGDTLQQLIERDHRLHQIGGLIAGQRFEPIRIEVEHIADELVRRLRLDPPRGASRSPSSSRCDHLRASLHRGSDDVAIFRMIRHRVDQVLISNHVGLGELALNIPSGGWEGV